MVVLPTAGAMQLNLIVGAYSSAMVLVAVCDGMRSLFGQGWEMHVPRPPLSTHCKTRTQDGGEYNQC